MSTPDFFRSRLDAMIDLRHPLAVLANRMPWTSIEATLTPIFEGRAREGRVSEEVDLFGVAPKLAGAGISAAGRPRLSIRLMVGLLYLKHAYNERDESVCERWAQDVYFQILLRRGLFPAAPAMRSDQPGALSAGAGRSRCRGDARDDNRSGRADESGEAVRVRACDRRYYGPRESDRLSN